MIHAGLIQSEIALDCVKLCGGICCRYEGPACDIDINECVRGTAACAQNAGCTNTNGSFACTCYYGYSGANLAHPVHTVEQAGYQLALDFAIVESFRKKSFLINK